MWGLGGFKGLRVSSLEVVRVLGCSSVFWEVLIEGTRQNVQFSRSRSLFACLTHLEPKTPQLKNRPCLNYLQVLVPNTSLNPKP